MHGCCDMAFCPSAICPYRRVGLRKLCLAQLLIPGGTVPEGCHFGDFSGIVHLQNEQVAQPILFPFVRNAKGIFALSSANVDIHKCRLCNWILPNVVYFIGEIGKRINQDLLAINSKMRQP